MPPSTGSSMPVVKIASNARNEQRRAGDLVGRADPPHRRDLIALFRERHPHLFGDARGAHRWRLMKPWLTEFTRMLRGSSSAASTRAKDFTAAFDAEYTLMPALPLSLAMDVVKTIAPPSRTRGARRCTVKNAPLVFTAKNEPGPTS